MCHNKKDPVHCPQAGTGSFFRSGKLSGGKNYPAGKNYPVRELLLCSSSVFVKVDQASGFDNLALVLCHVEDVEVNLRGFSILDDVTLDVGEVAVEGLADAGDIDVMTLLPAILTSQFTMISNKPVSDRTPK